MGAYGGPDIITDGLVFAVDAGSERSYPGTGTTASNIIDSSTGTLVNGVAFNSANGGYWEFDGVDDKIDMGTGLLNLQNASFTLSTWIKWDGGSQDTFFGYGYGSTSRQNIHWRIYTNGMLRFDFFANSINSATGTIVAGEWVNLTVTFNYTTTTTKCYKNGTLLLQGTVGPFTGIDASSTATIGSWGNSQYYGGDIPSFKAYNKTLSASEVLQNYNAQKNRFI
jgi:hypothetical protein